MYSSEAFGRLFWVDDNYDFKSCPLCVDETGDFAQEDYVSEWEDWSEVDMKLLFNIYKNELINKVNYANSLTTKETPKVTHSDVNDPINITQFQEELEEWGVYSAAKIDFDDKELNVDLLDNFILKECN